MHQQQIELKIGDYVQFCAPDSKQLALVEGHKGYIIAEKWGGYKVDFGEFEFIAMLNELKLVDPPAEPVKQKRHRRTKAEMQAETQKEEIPVKEPVFEKEVLF